MITTTLSELGFSDKEIDVYIAILQNRRITPAQLARKTHLKRTSVYHVIDELLHRGVVSEDKASSTRTLLALPPEDLGNLILQEEENLREKKYLILQAVDQLRTIQQETLYPLPKITYVSEEHLFSHLSKQIKVWNESMRKYDSTWWGFQDPSYVGEYAKAIDEYWTHATSKDISLKLLTNQSDTEKKIPAWQYDRRHLKYWQQSGQFTATTWIVGDYVIVLRTHKHPHYLIEHHDPELAASMRQLFQGIWATIP